MSGYRKLIIERARAKEAKQRRIQWEKEQAIVDAAAAVAAKIERKENRRRQRIEHKRQQLANKRLQLRSLLLPAIQPTTTTPTKPSTNSPTRLLRTTDGGWYTGETDEKKRRHGFGCRYYRDGSLLYRGQYRLARFHGRGERYAQDGRIMYRGEYVDDEPHGIGRGWSRNGESFEGDWVGGKPIGKGTLFDKTTGLPFWFGKVLDWKPHGEGSLLSPVDGSVLYIGTVFNRIRQGFGIGVWPIPRRHNKVKQKLKQKQSPSDSQLQQQQHDGAEIELGLDDSSESDEDEEEKDEGEENDTEDATSATSPSPRTPERLRFRGQWVNNIPQGKGILFDDQDQERHVGTWLNGLLHGKGVHTYADGAIFHGEWIHGKAQGQGEWIGRDGSRLECTWVDGHRSGTGKWTGPKEQGDSNYVDPIRANAKGSRSSHRGKWKQGAMEGPGEWWGADGSHYKGMFKDNKRNGHGTLKNADGTVLIGKWKNGKLHGNSELFAKEADIIPRYGGMFDNGEFHGKGTYTYEDGTVYQGEWRTGQRHGHGEFRAKNGTVGYQGAWKDDLQDGTGMARILGGVYKGCVYHGSYVAGKREGLKGELSTAEGRLLYSGGWKNDLFEGHGEWWPIEGDDRYVGQFNQGARHGTGTMHMEDGRIYVGEWEMGVMHGQGRLSGLPQDEVMEGEFEDNQFLESPEEKTSRLGYEPLIDEICRELANKALEEVIVEERLEAQRLVKLEWEMLDPEFEARKKIEEMRQAKLKREEERRLKKAREAKMKGAMLAKQRRERKQKERRERHDRREKYSELMNMLGKGR